MVQTLQQTFLDHFEVENLDGFLPPRTFQAGVSSVVARLNDRLALHLWHHHAGRYICLNLLEWHDMVVAEIIAGADGLPCYDDLESASMTDEILRDFKHLVDEHWLMAVQLYQVLMDSDQVKNRCFDFRPA